MIDILKTNNIPYNYYETSDNYGIKVIDENMILENIVIDNNDDIDIILLNNKNIYYSEFDDIFIYENDNKLFDIFKKEDIFIFNKDYGWFFINHKKLLVVEINNTKINGYKCNQILEYTADIFDIIKNEYKYNKPVNKIPIINARCENSMKLLDTIHREKIQKYVFKNNEIIAIKAVAGSGKTTTLLNLANKNKKDRILYLAFNKSLIEEIKVKKRINKIINIIPKTFDSIMRSIFILRNNFDNNFEIEYKLKNNISTYLPEFNSGNYKFMNVKSAIIKKIVDFCNQTEFNNIKDYIDNYKDFFKTKSNKWIYLFESIWELMLDYKIITFDSIRKLVQINNWAEGYIDEQYDKIYIDEAQDFDNVMLSILLNNTNIPKIFVGDPLQAIYQWRGSINTFEKLPSNSLIVEFYSTYRIGEPACSEIRSYFEDCWMISNNKNETIIQSEIIPEEKYTYLFRSWKGLLLTAKITRNIYINNYENKVNDIKKQHENLRKNPNRTFSKEEQSGFEDDLPQFLIKLSLEELTDLISSIENNLVDKEEADCIMTTIHSYKGLENDIIRIYDDIKVESEENIYYVALTRGINKIILDKKYGKVKSSIKIDTNKTDNNDFIKLIIDGKTPKEIAELNNISEDDLLLSEELVDLDFDLIDKLKQFRTNKAKELKHIPYQIFTNRVFKEFVINKPKNKKDLLSIKGFGEKMYTKYGEDIINIIKMV